MNYNNNIEFFDSEYSTYYDHRKSVEDMLRRNRMMYEHDLKNTMLGNGMSHDQIEKQKSESAIQNKLDMLKDTWDIAFDERQRLYDNATNVIQSNEDNQQKTILLVKKQRKEMSHNFNQINDIKNNLNTLRRQVEISMDESMRKNNKLYILKIVLVYLLLSILPILLVKEKAISQTFSIFIMVLLTILLFILIFWNKYQTRNRYPLRYSVRTFNTPSVEDVLDTEETEKDEVEDDDDNCEDMIKALKKLFTQAKLANQLCIAGQIRKKFREYEHERALGKKYCGEQNNVELSVTYKELKTKLEAEVSKSAKEKEDKAEALRDKLNQVDLEIGNKQKELKSKTGSCNSKKNELDDIKDDRKEIIEQLKKLGYDISDYVNPNVLTNVTETGIPEFCKNNPSLCPYLKQ